MVSGNRTEFVSPDGDARESVSVKNGFSWPAFFFGPLWAWSKGMWGVGFALFGGNLVVNAVSTAISAGAGRQDPEAVLVFSMIIPLAWAGFIGAQGNEWLRNSLLNQGCRPVAESGVEEEAFAEELRAAR